MRTPKQLVALTALMAAIAVPTAAQADARRVNITSSSSMYNHIDNGRQALSVNWRGRPGSGEYCYIALDRGGPTWNRQSAIYSCGMYIPYAALNPDNAYGYRVIVFVGRQGSAPAQKGWTSFKAVR